ncbi:MAG: hypothetical protein GOVbin8074_12 [Prokaryotic dsDNA virus sp.]|nr:MAG: hypothetical protein GOVbin8074_12 [Prokaryotic dsDNA virus sp.]|tara:strand:+ start:11857 stop:12471 length:615 start_codon:yes stop_codon:yes gene_type:complete
MKDKPTFWAVIPANVRYADITPNAKLLYAEITALQQMNGECYASNRYFSKLYNKNKVTISRWIKELRDKGLINVTIVYKEGTKEIANRYIDICDGGNSINVKQVLTKKLKNNNTSNNNNTTYSNKRRFVKPSIDDIIVYCQERNNNICAETFYDFYETKDWKVGKNKMKDWKACVRTWEKRDTKNNKSKIDSQIDEYLKGKELL